VGTGVSRTVAVIGGGVVGMATALELASVGQSCTLIDPAPGRGATWAAAGMLSPAAEVAPGESILHDLLASRALWPDFIRRVEAASSMSVDYRASASLLVGATASDERDLVRTVSLIEQSGIRAPRLGADELHALEPSLAAGVRGGWLLEGDARVDNRLLAEALRVALKAVGVTIVEDRCVSVDADDAHVRIGLEHQGTLDCDRCVLAFGASSNPPAMADLGLPRVRPIRGVTLRLGPVEGVAVPTRTIRGVVEGLHCYVVPRSDGSVVVGATSEEQGHSLVARAGGVHSLLDAARRLLPALDELSFEEASVGLRPATDDHVPFVGALRDPRVVAAVGHYRNGILLAPLAAQRATALIVGR
jgi:glycine oxidase